MDEVRLAELKEEPQYFYSLMNELELNVNWCSLNSVLGSVNFTHHSATQCSREALDYYLKDLLDSKYEILPPYNKTHKTEIGDIFVKENLLSGMRISGQIDNCLTFTDKQSKIGSSVQSFGSGFTGPSMFVDGYVTALIKKTDAQSIDLLTAFILECIIITVLAWIKKAKKSLSVSPIPCYILGPFDIIIGIHINSFIEKSPHVTFSSINYDDWANQVANDKARSIAKTNTTKTKNYLCLVTPMTIPMTTQLPTAKSDIASPRSRKINAPSSAGTLNEIKVELKTPNHNESEAMLNERSNSSEFKKKHKSKEKKHKKDKKEKRKEKMK